MSLEYAKINNSLHIFWLIRVGGAKLIVYSIYLQMLWSWCYMYVKNANAFAHFGNCILCSIIILKFIDIWRCSKKDNFIWYIIWLDFFSLNMSTDSRVIHILQMQIKLQYTDKQHLPIFWKQIGCYWFVPRIDVLLAGMVIIRIEIKNNKQDYIV